MRRCLVLALAAVVLSVTGPAEAKRRTKVVREESTSPLVYVGFATASVGLVVGTVYGVDSLDLTERARARCVSGRCPPETYADLDAATTSAWISNVALGVAALGVGIGVYGLLSSGSKEKSTAPSVSAVVGPTGLSLVGQF